MYAAPLLGKVEDDRAELFHKTTLPLIAKTVIKNAAHVVSVKVEDVALPHHVGYLAPPSHES